MTQADNTALYRLAAKEHADWVLFLDADELLLASEAGDPQGYLSSLPQEAICVRLASFRYAPPDETTCANPFEGLRARHPVPETYKIAARAVERSRLLVSAGNHYASIDGSPTVGIEQDRLWLAHVPERGSLQAATKAILSRLKPAATGSNAATYGVHRLDDHVALKTDARAWLNPWPSRTSRGFSQQVPYHI